jgi:segregation and condensation protein A
MVQTSNSTIVFRLNEFEGPLDLLLFLIKKNEVNIYDIPIAAITEQFLAFLVTSENRLGDMTEFYTLAAELVYIKSRMLLPIDLSLFDEIEDPRKDLVEKLIEYQKFKKLAELFEQTEQEAAWNVERKRFQRNLPFAEEEMWQKIDVWDLLKTFTSMIQGISNEKIISLYEEVTINEKTTLLYELVETRESFTFIDLITRPGSILDIVCAFLAILDAVKNRIIIIAQHRLFGDIQIRKLRGQYES